MRYLASGLTGALTHREKLVEAHHDSEHHIHLLNWQKIHRHQKDKPRPGPIGTPGKFKAHQQQQHRQHGSSERRTRRSPTKKQSNSGGRRQRSPIEKMTRYTPVRQSSPSGSGRRR
jgi:hypothetical protein